MVAGESEAKLESLILLLESVQAKQIIYSIGAAAMISLK